MLNTGVDNANFSFNIVGFFLKINDAIENIFKSPVEKHFLQFLSAVVSVFQVTEGVNLEH